MLLANKSIVVTGATGIAAAGALRVSREGGTVFVISLVEEECSALVDQIHGQGGEAAWVTADLAVESEADAAFEAATAFLGGLDGLLAVAGGSGRRHGDGPAHDISLTAWEETFRINTNPMFLASRNAIRSMRGNGGSMVLVSSVLATRPAPELFATHAYAAAKGATNALVTSLASYYAAERVRVNAIAPGLVRTPMSERAASDPATVEYITAKQPLVAGLLDPEDVAATAVFLLSDEASTITGQMLAVDGGWTVTEA